MLRIFLLLLFFINAPAAVFGAGTHYHASAGATSGQQLPMLLAKDLGLFDKYGTEVELLVVTGGSTLLQALIGGSVNSANVAAMAPVRAIHSGARLAITGAFLNKNLYSFITRKEIRRPADLRGKKIGVASLGGANQFSVLTALKAFGIPRDSVILVATGSSLSRLAAMTVSGGIDATVVPHSNTVLATQKGMHVLADLSELVKEFPDRTIIMERSSLKTDRAMAKGFLRAVSESIYRLKNQPQLRDKIVGVIQKRLKMDRPHAEETYETYRNVFSYPPRVGREGLSDVLEIVQKETGAPKSDFSMDRYLDESILDELQQEGFFKKLERELKK